MTTKEKELLNLLHDKIDKISDSIFGNGQTGLKSKVERMESEIDFVKKSIESTVNNCLSKAFFKIIIGTAAISGVATFLITVGSKIFK